ncbi:MAG: hypothetical protein ACOY46_16965 [Bacillota bacterium]
MGDKYIYDIIGKCLPEHLKSSLNTVRFQTKQTNYEIIVNALEKYFNDMGIRPQTFNPDFNSPFLVQTQEKDGFSWQLKKVKL